MMSYQVDDCGFDCILEFKADGLLGIETRPGKSTIVGFELCVNALLDPAYFRRTDERLWVLGNVSDGCRLSVT